MLAWVLLCIQEARVIMNNKAEMTMDDLREVLLENEVTNFDPVAEAFKVRGGAWFFNENIVKCLRGGYDTSTFASRVAIFITGSAKRKTAHLVGNSVGAICLHLLCDRPLREQQVYASRVLCYRYDLHNSCWPAFTLKSRSLL